MNRISTLFLLLFLTTAALNLSAQRYETEIFDEVKVTANVQYAVNATALFLPTQGEAIPIPLFMDIYEPEGDTETERPLVLVFHTGNFLPPVLNRQISGSRKDSSSVEICTQLARRGFVAAAVDYRTGWDPEAPTQPERAVGLIQAAYRGVQDGRTAIRFFRRDYQDNSNQYGIDPSRITAWGNGTGGYLVLGMAGLSNYNEIITTTNPTGKFLLDLDMNGVPETPMVVQAYHGDINGEVTTAVPDDAFGFPAGDTTNYANHVGYSNEFHLTVNAGGALGDISWLADQEIPIISIQSINDPLAPYNDAILIVPTTGDPIVQVQGLQQIGASQEASGINQPWKALNLNDGVTQDAMTNAATAGHPYYEGSFSWFRPANSDGIDEGVVVNWWNPNDIAPPPFGMGLAWNQLPHPSGLGSYHEVGLISNEGMSAAKARANIADIMDYVIPRACVTLDLGCPTFTDVRDIQLPHDLVEVAPNPANGYVTISTADNKPIQGIEIFNVEGKLVSRSSKIMEVQQTVGLQGFTPGMYIMKVYMEDGFAVKKLMVK